MVDLLLCDSTAEDCVLLFSSLELSVSSNSSDESSITVLKGAVVVTDSLEKTLEAEDADEGVGFGDFDVDFAVTDGLVDVGLLLIVADDAFLEVVAGPVALVGVAVAFVVALVEGFGVWIVLRVCAVVLKLSDVLRIAVLSVVGIITVLALVMVNVVAAPV